jgi:hypothetical protein
MLQAAGDYCILHDPTNKKDTEFFETVFTILLKIHDNSDNAYDFSCIHFPKRMDLREQIFTKRILFDNSHFYSGADFSKSKFESRASFKECQFYGPTSFANAEFCQSVSFIKAKFTKPAIFKTTQFSGKVTFFEAEFLQEVDFFDSYFYGITRFVKTKFPHRDYYVKFMLTKFYKPLDTIFADVDFRRVLFRWSIISEIRFENVKWPSNKFRKLIADEFYRDDKEQDKNAFYGRLNNTQDLYQQLKLNYERKGNFSEAGDFFYGEMECKRKVSIWSRYFPSLINIYRLSCGYGQKYIRAICVFLVFIGVFVSSHMFLGLEGNQPFQDKYIISYNHKIELSNSAQFTKDFGLVFVYCIEILIREPQKDRLFLPTSLYGEVLNTIFSVLIYLQLIFIALSIRRNFKR